METVERVVIRKEYGDGGECWTVEGQWSKTTYYDWDKIVSYLTMRMGPKEGRSGGSTCDSSSQAPT